MKIHFNIDDNISSYSLKNVIQGIKLENEGEQVFNFDSNFSLAHFFNYFIEESEKTEDFESSLLLHNYFDSIIKNLPPDVESCVNHCYDLLDYDEEIEKIFSSTNSKVICAFLYTNFYSLIYDELCLFYIKSALYKNLVKTFETEDPKQLIYEIILKVADKLKEKIGNSEFVYDNHELLPQDLSNFEYIPNNSDEAINWLVEAIEKHGLKIKNIDFDGTESVDILTCFIYAQVNHIILYNWYLYHEKSPLRIWLETNKNIKDPYSMVYYLVKNFTNYITLKFSMNAV